MCWFNTESLIARHNCELVTNRNYRYSIHIRNRQKLQRTPVTLILKRATCLLKRTHFIDMIIFANLFQIIWCIKTLLVEHKHVPSMNTYKECVKTASFHWDLDLEESNKVVSLNMSCCDDHWCQFILKFYHKKQSYELDIHNISNITT